MGFLEKFEVDKLAMGLKCKKIRKSKNITQRQVFEMVRLHATHLSSIERGKFNVTFETLYRLKIALKVEIAEMFDFINAPAAYIDKFGLNDLPAEKLKFSQRLTQLLEHRDINQTSLGVLLNIGDAPISVYVNGPHNLELLTMVKIAMALKVNVYDLFDYEGPLPDNNGYKQEIIEP